MLTEEQNRKLMEVGPGTLMGELLRRYWTPFAAVGEMEHHPIKTVRLLGEDLVLYKDEGGNYGLVDRHCPHRRRAFTATNGERDIHPVELERVECGVVHRRRPGMPDGITDRDCYLESPARCRHGTIKVPQLPACPAQYGQHVSHRSLIIELSSQCLGFVQEAGTSLVLTLVGQVPR